MCADFAPLVLPLSHVKEGLENNYKVYATSGEVVTVEASSAAEAMEKSGIRRPLRIVSIAHEQRRMMSRNVLHPQSGTVATDIDMEHYVPDFRSLVVDDLEEEEKPPFEECLLSDIAARTLDKLPEPSRPQPKAQPAPPPYVPPAAEPAIAMQTVAATPEPAPPAGRAPSAPAEQEVIPPERPLTSEEVEALMSGSSKL